MENKKDREEKTTSKNHPTDFRDENYPKSKVMVEEVHPICQDDTGYSPEHHDNRPDILFELRDKLEVKLNDIFIWALGDGAVTEMTKTVKENPKKTPAKHRIFSDMLAFTY